jgi:hypothetical protein
VGSDHQGVPLERTGDVLGADACDKLRELLDHGPYVEVVDPDSEHPHIVYVVELNQAHAPVRQRFSMTVEQFLRFVTAWGMGDWSRAEAEAHRADRLRLEAEESMGPSTAKRPAIALDRPINIIQATLHLERRARTALVDKNESVLRSVLLDQGGASLRKLVDFYLPAPPAEGELPAPSEAPDVDTLTERLVCWLSAHTLLQDLRPELPPSILHGLGSLEKALEQLEASWAHVPDEDRLVLRDWLRDHWRTDASPPQALPPEAKNEHRGTLESSILCKGRTAYRHEEWSERAVVGSHRGGAAEGCG